MENKGIDTNSIMLECPFCSKIIKVPNKPNVIFKCSHCHKDLISYDKRTEQIQQTSKNKKEVFSKKQLIIVGCLITLIIILSYRFFNEDSTKYVKKMQEHHSQTTANAPKRTVSNNVAKEQEQEKTTVIEEEEPDSGYQEIATWKGNTYHGDGCAYTLLKSPTGKLTLRENYTNNIFDCTKHIIQNSTEYYFVDPDIADINVNLACFNLKKGATIYIIHKFDYDSTGQTYMDGILVPFNGNNARIYLDLLTNGTAYYCNNGNPPISRLNEKGQLEYYNSDGSNEPAYECYAKLH